MKKYIYFVSFSCQNRNDYQWGFGCVEIELNNPITSLNQLAQIVPKIQDEHNLMKVTPLYYALLREEKDK